MTGQNSFWFANPSTSFYNGVATQSARFDGNAALNITHSSAPTDNTKGTVAVWIKLHDNNDRGYLIQTGSGTSNNNYMDIRFGGSSTNDGMHIGQYGRTPYSTSSTDPKQRDFSAWYHLLVSFDSTSATASERLMKIFINGVQVTSGTFGAISQNDHFPLTIQSQVIYIGRHTPSYNYFISANLADFHMIDGQALTPSSFTEIKNGICIPIAYTGSYGNNGFRLEFKQTGTSQNSSGIGADTSGNDNHWAIYSSTLSAYDSNMPDSPENNFAILNENDARYGTLGEGNLKNTYASTGELIRSTFAQKSGKWYAEVNCIAGSGFNLGIYPTGDLNKDSDTNYGCQYRGATGQKVVSNSVSSYGATYGADDIIGIAVDMDNNTVTFYKNNSSQGSISYTIDEHHAFSSYISSGNTAFWNFGQDSSFGGNETAQGNQDENGVGDFYYAPPSGYLALCSSNLSDTTLSPNQDEQADDHFNTIIYTGTGSSHSITGVGFQPDWIWFKGRNQSSSHLLMNSSVGNTKYLYSNATSAEQTDGTSVITSFDSDGYTVPNDTGGYANYSNRTYVAWNWKANGGTTSSNSSGDITSTVQANQTAGFSIILYTGFGEAVKTVGHGLSQAPEMIWFKTRSSGTWFVYHIGTGNTGYTFLNTNGAYSGDGNFLNNTSPTSSLITLGVSSAANAESQNFIAYAFHSVEGYSKNGTYTGNEVQGATVGHGLGKTPQWVIVKNRTDAGYDWAVWHQGLSSASYIIRLNLTSAETNSYP